MLNTVEVLISRALINSDISHDEFVSVNNVLRECDDMKEEIKNPRTINKYGWYNKKKLISEKKFTDINYGRLKIALS